MKDNKEIKKAISAINKMTDCDGRLGLAIDKAINDTDNTYDEMGSYLLSLANNHPDQLGIIEETVIAICGYGFETLRQHMKKQKKEYDSLVN